MVIDSIGIFVMWENEEHLIVLRDLDDTCWLDAAGFQELRDLYHLLLLVDEAFDGDGGALLIKDELL